MTRGKLHTPADTVRWLLDQANLSQVAGAKALDINVRTMRNYVGGGPVPRYIILALKYLVYLHNNPQ